MSNCTLTLPVCLNDPNSKSIHRRCAVSNLSPGVFLRSLPQISKRNPNEIIKRVDPVLSKEAARLWKKPYYDKMKKLFGDRKPFRAYQVQIRHAATDDDMELWLEYALNDPLADLSSVEVQPKDKYVQELQRLFPNRVPKLHLIPRARYKEYWMELRHATTTEQKESIMQRARKDKDATLIEPSGAESSNQAAQRPPPMNPAHQRLIEPSGMELPSQAIQRPPPVNPAHQHLISDAALQQLFNENSQIPDAASQIAHMESKEYDLKFDTVTSFMYWVGPKTETYYWQDGQKYVMEEGKVPAPAPWAFWLGI